MSGVLIISIVLFNLTKWRIFSIISYFLRLKLGGAVAP